jgi:hypothetical protein
MLIGWEPSYQNIAAPVPSPPEKPANMEHAIMECRNSVVLVRISAVDSGSVFWAQ